MSVAPIKIRPSPFEILQRQMVSGSFGGVGEGFAGLGSGVFLIAKDGSAGLDAHEVNVKQLIAIKR